MQSLWEEAVENTVELTVQCVLSHRYTVVVSFSQNLLQVVYEQHVENPCLMIIMIHIFLLNCNKCTDHYDMVPNMTGLYI